MRLVNAGGGPAREGRHWQTCRRTSQAAAVETMILCCSPEVGWVAGVGLGAGLGQGSRVEGWRGGGVLLQGGRGRGGTSANLPAGAGGVLEIEGHLQRLARCQQGRAPRVHCGRGGAEAGRMGAAAAPGPHLAWGRLQPVERRVPIEKAVLGEGNCKQGSCHALKVREAESQLRAPIHPPQCARSPYKPAPGR